MLKDMSMRRCGVVVVLSVLIGVSVAPIDAQTGGESEWRKHLEAALESRYELASLTWNMRNIKEAGTPCLLMQPNVLAERSLFRNVIVAGQPQRRGAGGFMSDLLRQSQDNDATRDRVSLPRYQPVYITDVRVARDAVFVDVATTKQFIIESVDRAAIARFVQGTSVKGDTLVQADVTVRRAELAFPFKKNVLQSLSVDEVRAHIDAIVLRADDPRAPQFGHVAIGMSRDEVIVNLGKPRNVIDLGTKVVFVYPDLKVTLVDGRVTEAQ